MTKVLVTGGGGYIGSFAAEALAARGFEEMISSAWDWRRGQPEVCAG